MHVAQHGADMNIRQAILSAADSIEQSPPLFRFDSMRIPDGCGSPGCALGWIGFHLGMQDKLCVLSEVCVALNIKRDVTFGPLSKAVDSKDWHFSAPECAKALRQYADIHHPEEQDYIPASIRAIFTEQVTA